MLLVLLRALPSGDTWEDPVALCRRSGTFQTACVYLTILIMSFYFFSGAEEAFRFALERADPLFHLAVMPRALADPEGTVCKQLATAELYSGKDSVTFQPLVFRGNQRRIFFSHFLSLQTGKDCKYLSRNPVQKKSVRKSLFLK